MKKQLIIIPALTMVLMGTLLADDAHAFLGFGKKKENQASDGSQLPRFQVNTASPSEPSATSAPPANVPAAVPVAETAPVTPPKVQVKSPLSEELNDLKVEDPVESPDAPLEKTFVAVDDPSNPLGVTVSAEKLNTAAQMISQKRYAEAGKSLNQLKDWLVDATEAHINLHKTLKAVPSAQVQAELEKQLALQFALLRDKAFFQLGMLGIAQNDYSTAVKNLSRVIQSQPRSPMGAQAYEMLQKIGFTEKIQLREERKDSNVGQATP